jgi:NAD(P)-dependent dehydrogenase (short-subunit alcohol dehydrogenase family)
VQPSDILLNDHVAVVTGSGAGIGQGIAAGLANFGADVAVVDIDPDRAAVTAELVRASGREALVVPADMTDAEQVRRAIATVHGHFGRIDILVNNVGGVKKRPFVQQSERSMSKHVDLNLTSMLVATHEVVPLMIAAGRGGSIVNVASIEALRAAPGFAVYAACKAGMANFSRSLALEVGEHGIRVNTLAPDIIATPGIRGLIYGPVPDELPTLSEDAVGGIRRYVPLGGEGAPDDCAGATIFLCSKLGRYVTGTTISIDGGTLASSGWRRSATDPADWELFTG